MERRTRQRDAIQSSFERADRPLSPQEVLERAQGDVPTLGIATVYRNIKSLVELGTLQVVELPGQPARYEVAGKKHHHHFHCRQCDGVYEVDSCPGGVQAMAPGGFQLEAHEIILYGLCETCVD